MNSPCTQNTDRECKTEDCCLKKKKTRLIPFDYEKARKGAKVIYRNGNYPTEVFFPWTASLNSLCISSIYLGQIYTHFKNGYCNIFKSECDLDLFLEEEIEEHHFYINVYGSSENFVRTLTLHHDKVHADLNNCSRIGTLKVTYTDEDLIK